MSLPSCYMHQIICMLPWQRPLVRYWEEIICASLSSTLKSQRRKQVTGSLVTPSTFTCSTRRAVAKSWLFLTKHRGSSMEWEFWKHELLLHVKFSFEQLDEEKRGLTLYIKPVEKHIKQNQQICEKQISDLLRVKMGILASFTRGQG